MKNIIAFLKTFAIPIALMMFIAIGLANSCRNQKVEKVYNETEISTALTEQRLILETGFYKQLEDSSRIIQAYHRQISDGLKPVIVYKTAKAKASVEIARKDTNTTVIANTAINDQEELLFDMDLKAFSDSIQIAECAKRHIFKDSIVKEISRAYNNEVLINKNLQKAVKRNWLERNKSWISFIGGAGIMYYISK